MGKPVMSLAEVLRSCSRVGVVFQEDKGDWNVGKRPYVAIKLEDGSGIRLNSYVVLTARNNANKPIRVGCVEKIDTQVSNGVPCKVAIVYVMGTWFDAITFIDVQTRKKAVRTNMFIESARFHSLVNSDVPDNIQSARDIIAAGYTDGSLVGYTALWLKGDALLSYKKCGRVPLSISPSSVLTGEQMKAKLRNEGGTIIIM